MNLALALEHAGRDDPSRPALGIGPRDLIAILQAIKAAGAIQADIEVM